MSHSIDLPDQLFDRIQEIASEQGATHIDVIDRAIAQVYSVPQAKLEEENNTAKFSSLGERLRKTVRFVSGGVGTEGLSAQKFKMSEDDVKRIMGRN